MYNISKATECCFHSITVHKDLWALLPREGTCCTRGVETGCDGDVGVQVDYCVGRPHLMSRAGYPLGFPLS